MPAPTRHHLDMPDLRARIRSGETLIGVFSDLASPMAAELCGRAGFDWVVLDLEHGAATRPTCWRCSTRSAPRRWPRSSARIRRGGFGWGAPRLVRGIMLPSSVGRESPNRGRLPALPARRPAWRGAADPRAGLGRWSRRCRARVNDRIGDRPDRVGGHGRRCGRHRGARRGRRPFVGPADSPQLGTPALRRAGLPGRVRRSWPPARHTARRRHPHYDAAGLAPLRSGFRFSGWLGRLVRVGRRPRASGIRAGPEPLDLGLEGVAVPGRRSARARSGQRPRRSGSGPPRRAGSGPGLIESEPGEHHDDQRLNGADERRLGAPIRRAPA